MARVRKSLFCAEIFILSLVSTVKSLRKLLLLVGTLFFQGSIGRGVLEWVRMRCVSGCRREVRTDALKPHASIFWQCDLLKT